MGPDNSKTKARSTGLKPAHPGLGDQRAGQPGQRLVASLRSSIYPVSETVPAAGRLGEGREPARAGRVRPPGSLHEPAGVRGGGRAGFTHTEPSEFCEDVPRLCPREEVHRALCFVTKEKQRFGEPLGAGSVDPPHGVPFPWSGVLLSLAGGCPRLTWCQPVHSGA